MEFAPSLNAAPARSLKALSRTSQNGSKSDSCGPSPADKPANAKIVCRGDAGKLLLLQRQLLLLLLLWLLISVFLLQHKWLPLGCSGGKLCAGSVVSLFVVSPSLRKASNRKKSRTTFRLSSKHCPKQPQQKHKMQHEAVSPKPHKRNANLVC